MIGTLKLHEDKIKGRSEKREEKTLQAKALGKFKNQESECYKGVVEDETEEEVMVNGCETR